MTGTGTAIVTELQTGLTGFVADIGGVAGVVVAFIVAGLLAMAIIKFLNRNKSSV